MEKKIKIPKEVEEYIRKAIATDIESFDATKKHINLRLQHDIWNEKKFNKFSIEDFNKEDFWIIKALKTLEWLRKSQS